MNKNEPAGNHQYARSGYAWYVVILLTIAYILSYLDRWVMSLLVELIKADLDLTDTQMGLLLGFAFALFYATMGIPIGWLADRYNRRTIIAIGITLWSAATAAAGLARNYAQLFTTRMLVGVGEATLSPCALSLITDYFPPKSRGRAIAFYTGAVSIGSGIAYLVGGQIIQWAEAQDSLSLPVVGEIRPWQVVFIIVGLPGLLIAALMATVREPKRTGTAATAEMAAEKVGFPTAFRYLTRRWKSFFGVYLAMSMVTIMAYSHAWLPAYFSRTWDWDIPKFSLYNGLALLITGPLSVNFGGWLADRLVTRGRADGPVLVVLAGMWIMVVFSVAFPLMPSAETSFAVYVLTIVGAAMATATAPTALVNIAPGQIRSQTIALFYLTISMIGAIIGPSSVAFFTDFLFEDETAIRYSMALVPAVVGVIALFPALVVRPAYLGQLAERRADAGA
ncbi:MAG: MFS transporter [Gammaproteobacteria bacterium]|nr:MFS transporter [Gammaproteobacteria bacterium]